MAVHILQGHVIDQLRTLEPGSIHCCVTSPPYWGLRDYQLPPQIWDEPAGGCAHVWNLERIDTEVGKGNWAQGMNGRGEVQPGGIPMKREPIRSVANVGFCQHCQAWRGSLGLEPDPWLYVQHLVQVFREVRRVLRDDGSLWLNIGDSYAGSWGDYHPHSPPGKHGQRLKETARWNRPAYDDKADWRPPTSRRLPGFKPKDLIGAPWRVAFALQADGWWLRSAITLCKLNPMPESVRDRPTQATEMMFLLTKQPHYFYDQEAVREPLAHTNEQRTTAYKTFGRGPRDRGNQGLDRLAFNMRDGTHTGRNLKNWWPVVSEPFPEAHFATFGTKWIEPCIKAGTSERGCCSACGSPWVRIVERYRTHNGERADHLGAWRNTDLGSPIGAQGDGHWRYGTVRQHLGWRPTCRCDAGEPVPATVLDCFGGAGTTGLVADRLGRHAILIELSEAYIAMARQRIERDAPLLVDFSDCHIVFGHGGDDA